MPLLLGLLLAAMALFVAAVAVSGSLATRWLARALRQTAPGPEVPLLPAGPQPLPPIAPGRGDAALLAYPERLAALETRLVTRHQAVQRQLQLLVARREEVRGKGDRQDLVRKYDADATMLDRRAEGMRRVLGLVWRTRAILLLRVHLAVTARHRPALGVLPRSGATSGAPARAAADYHAAAGTVLAYRERVRARGAELDAVLPLPPFQAEIDPVARAEVEDERARVAAAYAALADRLERLADTLTFVGDHCASLAVVHAEPEELAPVGGPARLLDEVADAMAGLDALGSDIDATSADTAVGHLADGISHLEEAGLEADAEAAAHLEVDRLLKEFHRT